MKKVLVALTFAVALSQSVLCSSAQAAEVGQSSDSASITAVAPENHPNADVIVNKYRYYQKKVQRRRWNETRGYWVDPYWITIAVAE